MLERFTFLNILKRVRYGLKPSSDVTAVRKSIYLFIFNQVKCSSTAPSFDDVHCHNHYWGGSIKKNQNQNRFSIDSINLQICQQSESSSLKFWLKACLERQRIFENENVSSSQVLIWYFPFLFWHYLKLRFTFPVLIPVQLATVSLHCSTILSK